MEKVFVENTYFLHGYWVGLVERYEEMLEKHHPGLSTHVVGGGGDGGGRGGVLSGEVRVRLRGGC